MKDNADNLSIHPMSRDHWPEVQSIYKEGIDTGNATFETEAPEWRNWDERHMEQCRIVADNGRKILGWAALSPVSDRCIYGGVAEVSVYVSSEAHGQGIGSQLLNELIRKSEEAGIWTLQAGIFPENEASIHLHQKHGFRIVGRRERIGKTDEGVWRDILLLERRSNRVGTD